ncbi:MAG: D-Ala-D-Ala carboxypeptidase family metallohydrolase, partial [Pseudomonadota bacterium]
LLGAYPTGAGRPPGLLKVEEQHSGELVSPHLRLGDLVSRQPQQWPRYLLFSTALLEQLELVPQVLAQAGFPDARISILSAYRTPTHNRAVGGAARSRHIYGDAADLIVDSNADGRMDDLNGDGLTSRADVEWLIARLQRAGVPVAIGGVGSYESTGPAGAFLHMDARGRAADWQR